jgi:sulfate adenylyltransferase
MSSSPFRILFVCTANICRSPFLELYATQRLGSAAVAFSSAGTHGFVDHPISDEMGVEAATNWGLDVTGFRSRRLTGDLVDEADLVLTAERRHRQLILDDHAHANRLVLTLGQAVRAAAVASASRDRDGLLAQLARHRGMAGPSDDIADPYRQGAAAQSAAAAHMSAMLDALRPLLDPLGSSPSRKCAHG